MGDVEWGDEVATSPSSIELRAELVRSVGKATGVKSGVLVLLISWGSVDKPPKPEMK